MASTYGNAIGSEGILQSLLADLAAQDAADRSNLTGSIGRLVGDYGAVPAGYADRFGALTPQVRGLAESNPFSFMKQSQRNLKQRLGAMRANRAGRGVIRSGGTALQSGDINYNAGLEQYTALRSLLDSIGGLESGYADSARQRLGQMEGAYGDAVGRLLEAGFTPGAGAGGQMPTNLAAAAGGRTPGFGVPTAPVGSKNRWGFVVAPSAADAARDPALAQQRQAAIAANSQTNLNREYRSAGKPRKITKGMSADERWILNDQWTKYRAGDKRWWV